MFGEDSCISSLCCHSNFYLDFI